MALTSRLTRFRSQLRHRLSIRRMAAVTRYLHLHRHGSLVTWKWFLHAAALGSMLAGATYAAGEPEVRVGLDADEIFLGESVTYQVEIRNAPSQVEPDVSPLQSQFDVVPQGDHASSQSSMTIINGRVTREDVVSHTYQYRLTPKLSGELTVPGINVVIDGKPLAVRKLPLRVTAPEAQDVVVAELAATPPQVYPTQPFVVTLRIYVRPLPDDDGTDPLMPLRRRPPQLAINWHEPPDGLTANETQEWLQPLVARNGVGFTINEIRAGSRSLFDSPQLAIFDLASGRETRVDHDGKSVEYHAYQLARKFTPEKTGKYEFGPALIKGTFVAGMREDEFIPKRLAALAPAISVEVREVPSPRPVNYCGGIGSYQVRATASPAQLRVGDPLTLTLEFERDEQSGALELISAPELTAAAGLTEAFELVDKNPTGREEGNVKRFSYALRPKKAGVHIPALSIATFDPQEERFQDLLTEPISLDVAEAMHVTSGDLVGDVTSKGSANMKTSAEGIFQNVTDLSVVHDERVNIPVWTTAVACVWGVSAFVACAVSAQRRYLMDPRRQRRQQARRRALDLLAEASTLQATGNSPAALRHVRSAIIGLIADTRDRVAEGLTAGEIDLILRPTAISDEDRATLIHLLESLESAEFSGASTSVDASVAISEAESWIARNASRLLDG